MSDDIDDDEVLENSLKTRKLNEATKDVLDGLTAREAKVLRMRFGVDLDMNHSLEEVGKQFDITCRRIREIEEKALRKLRNPRKYDPDDDGPDAA